MKDTAPIQGAAPAGGAKVLHAALAQALLATGEAGGDRVFQDLALYLTTALSADAGFVARIDAGDGAQATTLGLYAFGAVRDNATYPLPGTPCDTVVQGTRLQLIASGAAARFPSLTQLFGVAVAGYAGLPIVDAHGRALGLIAVVSREPMTIDAALAESLLRIFCLRAAAELERRAAEAALRASEANYRAMFDASVEGLALIDDSLRYVDVNPAFQRLVEYPREQIIGASLENIRAPQARERAVAVVRAALGGERARAELAAPRLTGGSVEVEIEALPVRHRASPHALVVTRDLTERRCAEDERARFEAHQRQSQKMEALGQLAGGIAHDFNNHLASIMGHLTLAAEREAGIGDAKLARYLGEARRSGEHARDLIRQMLTFGRGKRTEARSLALPPLVREVASLVRAALPAGVELHTRIDDSVAPVLADPVRIEQILMNLAINARDAVGAAGVIALMLRRATGGGACASCGARVRGQLVECVIADDGPGIPPEVVPRMFEPFFTTKEVGRGSGMGLATVHALVHELGGHVLVETAAGAGARFRVLFPVDAARESSADEPAPAPVPRRTGALAPLAGHVLVVDDDAPVLEFLRELLEGWGVTATAVGDPLQARDLVLRQPRRFDAVLTDHAMPRLTGLELARTIAAARPDLPVLLCSGYGAELDASALAAARVRGVLDKPVDPALLHEHLARCLIASGGNGAPSRHVRLGTSAVLLAHVLPATIRGLRAAHPEFDLSITTGSATGLIDRVLRRVVDLGLVTLPVDEADLMVVPVAREELVALLPAGAAAPAVLDAEALAARDFIFGNRRSTLAQLIRAWFDAAGAVPRGTLEIDSVEGIKRCVAAGLGAAIVPCSAVLGEAMPAGVVARRVEPRLYRSLGLIRRRDAPARPEVVQVAAALSNLDATLLDAANLPG
jgi:PAS domain S-box-containing protein